MQFCFLKQFGDLCGTSLHRCYLSGLATSERQCWDPCSGPQRTKNVSSFIFPFKQISKSRLAFFNRLAMAHTREPQDNITILGSNIGIQNKRTTALILSVMQANEWYITTQNPPNYCLWTAVNHGHGCSL